MKSLRI